MEDRTLTLTTEEVALVIEALEYLWSQEKLDPLYTPASNSKAMLAKVRALVKNIKFQTGKPKGF